MKIWVEQAKVLLQAWEEVKYSSKVDLAKAFGISQQVI